MTQHCPRVSVTHMSSSAILLRPIIVPLSIGNSPSHGLPFSLSHWALHPYKSQNCPTEHQSLTTSSSAILSPRVSITHCLIACHPHNSQHCPTEYLSVATSSTAILTVPLSIRHSPPHRLPYSQGPTLTQSTQRLIVCHPHMTTDCLLLTRWRSIFP